MTKGVSTYKALWMGGTALASIPSLALLAGLSAGAAHATPSYAYANLTFSNLSLSGVPAADITGSSVVIDDKATFNNVSQGFTSNNGNLATGATVSQAYVGPGPTPPAASHQDGPPFVAASGFGQELLVTPGTRAFVDISGAITGPASSQEVSEGHLASQGSGSSNTDSKTQINIQFGAIAGQSIKLSFDYSVQEITSIGMPGDVANVGVTSSYVILSDGNQVYSAGTDQKNFNFLTVNNVLNHQINDHTGAPNTKNYTQAGHLDLVYTTTSTGVFTLNINSGSNEQIIATPEPATLALLGTGLLGVGILRRRRRQA